MPLMGPKERGRRSFATFRRGIGDFPGWAGMRLYGDPSQLQNYFRHIRDGRPKQGVWFRRMGYEQLNTSPVYSSTAHFNWLSSVETNPLRIYCAAGGCTSVSTAGFSLTWFDIDQEPRLQRGTYYSTINGLQVGLFDSKLYIGLNTTSPRGSEFRRYETVVVPWGADQLDLAGAKQEYPVYSFSGRTVEWLEPFDDKLFISLDDGGADSRIAVYNGLSIYDGSTATMPADLSAMANHVTCMAQHRDFLVMGYAAAANRISVRTAGDVPGTYTHITPAAGTIVSRRMAAWKNLLWVVPGGTGANATNIWSWNDTDPPSYAAATLAVAHTIANSEIRAVAVFNGFLYYGWRNTSNGHIVIGRYDGTTWTDTHKDLTAQASDSGSVPSRISNRIDDLIAHRGVLYGIVFTSAGVSPVTDEGEYLVYSDGTNTSGTWIIQNRFEVDNAPTAFPATHPNDRRLFSSPGAGSQVARALVA
jgi:hypothetical protein